MPWAPTTIITESWGRLQVVVNGTDVTYFRDVPTQVISTEFTEPFGDGPAQIRFPQITSFEALPAWLIDFANIEINRVNAAGAYVETIWEGLYVSQGDDIEQGLTIDCPGALYQADFYKKPPTFDLDPKDLGRLIPSLLNPRVTHYGLRLNYMAESDIGLWALNRGSWQPLLTGYIQDLLATATLITDLGKGIAVGLTPTPDNDGYWVTGSEGVVISFGDTFYYGSRARLALNEPIAGMITTVSGNGYWLGAEDGGVFAYGDAVFYGSMPATDLAEPVSEIERSPSGNGYWLLGKDGGVFAFGDATFHGNVIGTVVGDAIDITATPTGNGYWILGDQGHVYAVAGATHYGNGSAGTWVAIERTPTGLGYWLLRDDGRIEAKGDAVHHGDMQGITLNKRMHDMAAKSDGTGYWLMAEDGGVFAFDVTFYGSVPLFSANYWQYTLTKEVPRTPVLKIKDMSTIHWTVTCGTPGVKHRLSRDLIMAPNVIYGEGVAPDGCHWRNTIYPSDETIDNAFFLPLAAKPEVEPFTYDEDGQPISSTTAFDPQAIRIEDYENMGDQLSFREGIHSAKSKLARDYDPGWMGTLILNSDPVEGSRLNIRAGQNILVKAHRGADRLYHIAGASINWESLRVTLTVDTKARDLMTIAGLLTRDRDFTDPAKRPKPTRRNSRLTEDRVAVFDCEAGAGTFAVTAPPNGWAVVRVAFAERGTISKTVISTEPNVEFAVAVFDKMWSADSLHTKMPDGPFSYDEDGNNPWDSWTGDDDPVMVWGGVEQPAGYSPELKNEEGEITGDLIDDSSWYYESKHPPWLWVGLFHEEDSNVAFTGTFTPGVLAAN